ncbi:protein-S-isoprenylcysteine O-methyltransferase-like isoform X5 [Varroa destructor]|uniref:Protein-S-isoprenylcysteine O-methyltransferase n=1 Tax=Varroa destructor TaxID=109461 RepID=A0A7M7KM17_VARDE|nr:protein-S-isoprenylcysteine O-methyltransferase-like isoform X5 [Varroa destructor]
MVIAAALFLRRPEESGQGASKVQWRAAMLGSACGASILTACLGSRSLLSFALYGITLSMFHFTEYLSIAYINPRNLNLDSFLLNHSKEYHIAMVASWFEYFVELYFYPDLKSLGIVACSGLVLCAMGEALRKCAMLTAGSNFHHLVRVKREENHQLVTSGVYSICRHPSYAGWFLWSVGTQLLLANPFCLIAYTMFTWMFFRERVEEEEITLLEFFGEEYAAYQKRVATGLPFIKGFKMEL